MKLQQQEQRLLALVRDHQQSRCRGIIEQAEQKRRQMIKDAWCDSRQQLHQAVKRERKRICERVHAARAELETKRRQHQQGLTSLELDMGLRQLRETLIASWSKSKGRHDWLRHTVSQGKQVLPQGDWHISYADPWDEGDQSLLHEMIPFDFDVQFASQLQAGLIIRCDGVVLDMSLQGLLGDSERIKAYLLALLHKEDT